MAHILIGLTSYPFLLNGERSGLWLEEFAVPYNALTAAGHRVTVASTAGGQVPIDPVSDRDGAQSAQWPAAAEALKASRPLTDFAARDFDAIYLPGGHGTMFDLPYHTGLHDLLFAFFDQGKPVGCVCHAPAVFCGMRRADGSAFIAGRRLAAFTDSEEAAAGGTTKVPFLLASRLQELGATHEPAGDFQPQVVRDGQLITGQNPPSSQPVADALLAALPA